MGRSPLSVVVHTFLNIFSTETIRPVKVSFHMEPLWDGEMNICSNGPGHMTKMIWPPCPYIVKTFSEPNGQCHWNLVYSIKHLSTYVLPKNIIEKSREYHNHKQQPTPDTKRKRKMKQTNTYKTNIQMHKKHTDQLPSSSPSEEITMLKGMKKQEDKEHRKTFKHDVPHSINYKATQHKNNTGTTALQQSVA